MDVFAPLKWFVDWLVFDLFAITEKSSLGNTLNFFIYDSIKILILLTVIVFVISFIRSYFPPEKTKAFLAKFKFPIVGNFFAALIGVLTPFCSCSAVPMFIGFLEAGVPLGATFSFLISAPMVNEVALILLYGMFGWKIALIYLVSGVLIATIAGWVIGKLKLEKWVEEFVWKIKSGQNSNKTQTIRERLIKSKIFTTNLVKKVSLYIIAGVAIGAFIHGYLPDDFLVKYAGRENIFAVPLATLIGIPLYSNAAGTIPIVSGLVSKGVAMGTALSFMMAVTALSLPEFIILKKVLKLKAIMTYALIVGLGVIFTGYLFNFVL